MDFLSQLLSKQQAPPPQSEAKKKQIADAKKTEEARKKYFTNYRLQATQAVEDFIKTSQRLKMKFAPADQTIRGIIHQIAEDKGLTSHSFGEEGVDRYVYLYKKEYHLTEIELACYREGRVWDPSQRPIASGPSASSEPDMISSPDVISPQQSLAESTRTATAKRNISEISMARMSAQSAEVVRISRESFGNVPTSVKTDRRTMAQVQSDIRAKKRLKAEVEKRVDEDPTKSSG